MTHSIKLTPADAYNEALMEHVHPYGWQNPKPAGCYNLVVLGAGTAGLVTAAGAAGLGAKVALLERGLMGGDCLNHGCVPSKGVIRAARAMAAVRHAGEFGIEVPEGAGADFGAVMARMRRLRSNISVHDSAARFGELGVDVFLGEARFLDANSVEVCGEVLRFKKAVVATGARAYVPPIPGLDAAGYHTNETIFGLTELPARLLVVGGGPIGCELAQTFQRLGARVTQVEMGPHIMPREDADAAAIVRRAMARDGVTFLTETEVTRVEVRDGVRCAIVAQGGKERAVETDAILIGAGRAPNVEGLGLEAAGVTYDARAGVHVDDTLRTSNRRVFACGDVCQALKFTHAADAAARIVIQNALFPFLPKGRFGKLVIPWCTYTDPEIAHVGLSEAGAKRAGIAIDTFTIPMDCVDRAILDGETEGMLKVHVAKGKDRILGATLVSAHAGESIGALTAAMTHGLGLGKLGKVIQPYPTQAEAIKKAADAYSKSRLTPVVARLLKSIIGWQRAAG